jgi:hypothetical protein
MPNDNDAHAIEFDVEPVGHLVIFAMNAHEDGEVSVAISTDTAITLAIRLMAAVGHALDIV